MSGMTVVAKQFIQWMICSFMAHALGDIRQPHCADEEVPNGRSVFCPVSVPVAKGFLNPSYREPDEAH